MPMFDDPNRELQRLQEQLLAEEEDKDTDEIDDLIEEYSDEDYESFFEEDYQEEYEREPFYRNYSNGYGAGIQDFSNGYRGEALIDDDDNAYDDGYDKDEEPYAVFREEKRRKGKNKEKGLWKLEFILLLEILGILAILIWWAVMLR